MKINKAKLSKIRKSFIINDLFDKIGDRINKKIQFNLEKDNMDLYNYVDIDELERKSQEYSNLWLLQKIFSEVS